MTTKKTAKRTKARRFALIVLDGNKTYTPIRAEDGAMEYELTYAGEIIGTAYSADGAENALNDYAMEQLLHARMMEAA